MAQEAVRTVGIVGVGDMGGAIADHLASTGFPVVVTDVRPEPVAALVAHGAIGAASISELTRSVDVVAVVVQNDEQLTGVVREILDSAVAGQCIVVHSTVLPATVVELAARAGERGVALVDAPVSGGAEKAQLGMLTVMVGGDDEPVNGCRPYLESIGTHVLHLGPVGAGQVMKLTNNALTLAGYAVLLEAMALARAYGLDEDAVTRAVAVSQGDSRGVRTWGRFDRIRRTHTLAGSPALYDFVTKDLREAIAAAADRDVEVPLITIAAQLLPDKLIARDADLAEHPLPPIPRCRGCGQELAAPFRTTGLHPECDD